MKRSNINRRGSSNSSGSATVEMLESRQMFCYAPLHPLVAEKMDEATAEQPLEAGNWSNMNRAEQTSGSTRLTDAGDAT